MSQLYIYICICARSQVQRPPKGRVPIWWPSPRSEKWPQNHSTSGRFPKKVCPERAPEGRNRAPNQANQRHEAPEPQRRRGRGTHQHRKQAKMTKISATRGLRPQRGRGSTTEGAQLDHRGGEARPQRGRGSTTEGARRSTEGARGAPTGGDSAPQRGREEPPQRGRRSSTGGARGTAPGTITITRGGTGGPDAGTTWPQPGGSRGFGQPGQTGAHGGECPRLP